MTVTKNRALAGGLLAAVLAVCALLVLGLSGIGIVNPGPDTTTAAPVQATTAQDRFDQNLDDVGRLMTADHDESYLTGLRADVPGLWRDADDAQLVQMGRLGCTLAEQDGGDWTEPVTIINSYGFDPRDTGVLVFHAVQNFCPDTTF